MSYNFQDEFKKILLNKVLIFFVIFTTVLCFGFTITSFSIGVDDPAAYHYLFTDGWGSMIQQGRLLHVLYNAITGALEFLPFFNDFLGASLLALSALLFCTLFQGISHGKLSPAALTVFCCVYISNPIVNEKFIYNLDVVVTTSSYCTGALALMYVCNVHVSKTNYIKATAMLMLSISSYESFGFLFYCGVFAIFLLRMVNGERFTLQTLFQEGLKFAVVLVFAFAAYYSLVAVVQLLSGQYGLFHRNNGWTSLSGGLLSKFFKLTKDLAKTFLRSTYFPVKEFTFFSVSGLALFIFLALKKRNVWILPCYLAMFAGNLIIHYICGFVMNRAAQTFCFFIAFVVMILVHSASGRACFAKLVLSVSVLLVLIQSAELNRWFYNDYIRYQKEAYTVNAIGEKLLGECDVSKPVVFLDHGIGGHLNNHYYTGDQVNGNSVIYWAERTFGDYDYTMMIQLFRMHGYDFLTEPTKEQVVQAMQASENIPPWPHEDCIVEMEDYIIVNLR